MLVFAAIRVVAEGGAVAGSVIDAATKAPIAEAVVKLYRADKVVQTVSSNAQGLFRIDGLADGTYRAVFNHSGHLRLASDDAAARTFVISAASAEIRLEAQLMPAGQIGGRVLNPTGESMKGVPVALRRPWDDEWNQVSISGDEGRFRFLNLEPGTWILGAAPTMRIWLADPTKNPKPVPDPAAEERQTVGWVTTFFPGTPDLAGAAKIVLRPGGILDGYDVKLRTAPLRRLSGVVIDEDGNRVPKAGVSLSDVANKGVNGAFTTADGEGRFAFDSVKDGQWRIRAGLGQTGRTLKGYADVWVSRSDVEGIEVRVTAPFPVKGFVEREEPRDQEGNRKASVVFLIPQAASQDMQVGAPHNQDGTFVLKNVYRGRYRVLPAGYAQGYYVASIWYGDQEVTTQAIEVVNPPLPLRIVYKSGAGRAAGTVDRGEGTWVVLVPQDEALRDPSQFIRRARCEANGKFAIDSLRPGSYYAFAFDRIRIEMLEDVEFVRTLVPRAMRVEIRHGEVAHLDLAPQVWPDY